jgi:hypothetical protein
MHIAFYVDDLDAVLQRIAPTGWHRQGCRNSFRRDRKQVLRFSTPWGRTVRRSSSCSREVECLAAWRGGPYRHGSDDKPVTVAR